MSCPDILLIPTSISKQTEKSGTHSQVEQNEYNFESSGPLIQHRTVPAFRVPVLTLALVLEFMAMPIVSMEKGSQSCFLFGICRPLAFVKKPSTDKV